MGLADPQHLDFVAVIGAGSWGTALAIHLAATGVPTLLWGRESSALEAMAKQRCNERYLPEIEFPDLLIPQADLQRIFEQATIILLVVPSHGFHQTLEMLKPYWRSQNLVWATKGIDPESNTLLSQIADEILGREIPKAILSGPSFAKEVALGLPTAVAVASSDHDYAAKIAALFSGERFRSYTNSDVVGVQIAGAVKNVMAIATGVSDGLGYGANARSALITRGLAEMVRLGTAMGGQQETFMGLAGLGDLVLTCTDNQSRNRRFGLALGKGLTQQQAKDEIQQVIEGIETSRQIYYLAKQYKIEMPICEQVYKIVNKGLSVEEAVENLFHRELTAE